MISEESQSVWEAQAGWNKNQWCCLKLIGSQSDRSLKYYMAVNQEVQCDLGLYKQWDYITNKGKIVFERLSPNWYCEVKRLRYKFDSLP